MKGIIALTLGFALASTAVLAAPSKWHVGFNENYASGYLLSLGKGCEGGCPSNTLQYSLTDIDTEVLANAQAHMGFYREIIPAGQVKPTATTNNFADIADVINIYEDYNLRLVLSLGITVPYWMGTINNWEPMPVSDADWTILKNNLAWTMGDLVKYLKDDPRISATWIQERLYIDPFNEFDALGGASLTAAVAGERAAGLANGIDWVLDYHGVAVDELMTPSYAGVQPYSSYLSTMYTYTSFRPNFHIYDYGTTASAQVAATVAKLANWKSALPVARRGEVLVGEAGVAESLGDCATSSVGNKLISSEYANYHAMLAEVLDVHALLFWRTNRLTPSASLPDCEPYFGVTGAAKTNLLNYLSN